MYATFVGSITLVTDNGGEFKNKTAFQLYVYAKVPTWGGDLPTPKG